MASHSHAASEYGLQAIRQYVGTLGLPTQQILVMVQLDPKHEEKNVGVSMLMPGDTDQERAAEACDSLASLFKQLASQAGADVNARRGDE